MKFAAIVGLFLSCLVTGCLAARAHYVALEKGDFAPVTAAENMPVLAFAPTDRPYRTIGRVSVEVGTMASQDLVVKLLRERAAEAGGEALADLKLEPSQRVTTEYHTKDGKSVPTQRVIHLLIGSALVLRFQP